MNEIKKKMIQSSIVAVVYGLYAVFLLVGLAGSWDFATVALVCSSIHFIFLLPGIIMYPCTATYWPYKGFDEAILLKYTVIGMDVLQFFFAWVPSVHYVRIGDPMPSIWIVIVAGLLFIGILTCFVKHNYNYVQFMKNETENWNRGMSATGILGLSMLALSFCLVFTTLSSIDSDRCASLHSTKTAYLWLAAFAFVVSNLSATVTYKLYRRLLKKYNKGSVAFLFVRALFVASGMLYVLFTTIAATLIQWGGECSESLIAKNSAWFAVLLWIVGTTLMHVMPPKEEDADSTATRGEFAPVEVLGEHYVDEEGIL